MKLWNDLRTAVANADPCDDAALRELDYEAPADEAETNDETAETAESEAHA